MLKSYACEKTRICYSINNISLIMKYPGGSNAIKVFYWCLSTGYRLLLSEGRAGSLSRWRKLVKAASDNGDDEEIAEGWYFF